jgi:hypothetical protein
MDGKAVFGELIKILGILITFLPIILFFIGIYLGLIVGISRIVLPIMVVSVALLIPCNIVGKFLYKIGLAIEMEAMGVASKKELRKRLEPLLDSTREDLEKTKVPDAKKAPNTKKTHSKKSRK